MRKRFQVFLIVFFIVLSFIALSCAHAKKPAKPGPNFIWVKGHKTPAGVVIPGHWRYNSPNVKNKTWVPGHNGPNGKWIAGHWKALSPPQKGSAWVPGHYGPGGKWISGHWR